MLPVSPAFWIRRRLIRLAAIILLGALAYPAAVVGPYWFEILVPPSVQFHTGIRLLEAARSGYIVLLASLPATLAILAAAIWLVRRFTRLRRWAARGLALYLALALGLALAEAGAAARLAWMRVPIPWLRTSFPDPPGEATVDVLVLGASSASGVPYQDWFSVGEIVVWKLQEALPSRQFPVTNLAKPGLKLDDVHCLLGTVERRPDLVILYAGHNEFQMRYGWSHGALHYDDDQPPVRVTFAGLVRTHSSVCRLIDQTVDLLLRATPPTRSRDATARGPSGVYRGRIRRAAPRLPRPAGGDDGVLRAGRRRSCWSYRPATRPISSRIARSCRPRRRWPAARRLPGSSRRPAGSRAADPAGAITAYQSLLDRQPGFAEAHYRLAHRLEATGRLEEANRHYIEARDRDGLPMRCMSEFQDVYREVAARHPRAILIDGPAVFRGLGSRGVVGDRFFTDGFHPSLIGYTALAEAILRGLHSRRSFGWGEASPAPVPAVSPSDCARHFGMDQDRWRQVCDYAAWFYGHTAYVRFDPSGRLDKAARIRRSGPSDQGRHGAGGRRHAGGRNRPDRSGGAGGEDGRVPRAVSSD